MLQMGIQPENEREGEGDREGEGERERERIDRGGAKLVQKPHNFIFKGCLYTLSFT